eukprot:TRINITY_DN6631_c0_g1_i1.p1 TRINITY_DN6631_c0_g1~~TRINITY_DN6631_c0_g1_i1.p1  ORF type:complete len:315 (+),score=45.79 TRINITY_DN6631_c0_g1_i1:319-1263(+)
MDIYVLNEDEFVGLNSIKFLSLMTGGNIYLYNSSEMTILPQDIYKQLKQRLGFRGILRLRTNTETKAVQALGHLCPDPNYENLYHIAGCDKSKNWSFDFNFTNISGYLDSNDMKATIQMAFAYNLLAEDKMIRVLRLYTQQLLVTENADNIYEHANINCVLSLLVHKVIRACLDEGINEGRLLLQDWLIIFIIQYNEQLRSRTKKNLDTSFSKFNNLKNLSRLVFALLKNPLLSVSQPCDSDYWNYLHVLFSSLSPRQLHKAIYPSLSSYGSANTLSSLNLPVSHSAVSTSGCRYFLLDGYNTVSYTHLTLPTT